MKTRFLLCLAVLAILSSTGCTYAIVNASIRYVSLESGTNRSEVVKILGMPSQSKTFSPTVVGNSFAQAPIALRHMKVGIYDEYHINGLVITRDYNPYLGFGESYTLGMYLTLGLGEIIYFPYSMVDLAVRGSRHYQLRLWYDASGCLLAKDEGRPPLNALPDPQVVTPLALPKG